MFSSSSHIQCPRRMPHLYTSSIMKCYFNKIFHLSIIHKRGYIPHSWGIKWIYVILSCLFLTINANMQQVEQCMNFPTAGWTVPKGEIIVKYGNNLQIWCNLNETFIAKEYSGTNSSNIFFVRDNITVEQKFVTIINKTTALLTIKSPPVGQFKYFCHLDVLGIFRTVCFNKVLVAYGPQRPKNFTCRSYNWKNITCTWDVSQHYVPTTHELLYVIHTTEGIEPVPCPTEKAKNDSCTWTQHTYPTYRQTKEKYDFIMHIQNMFGRKSFVFDTIDHFAIVIPAKPRHVSVINETLNSATLCWQSPFAMNNFPPGLTHKVMYKNHRNHHENKWKIINIDTEPLLHKRCSTLTGLHANTAYDARVYLRSAKAVEENMYSEPAVTIFKTLLTSPSFPPRTDIGSFEIVEHNETRDIYLYWQMIKQYHENGDKFKYHVKHVEENNHQTFLKPIEITKTYAKFEELSFNKYRFEIYSENEVGINKNYTEIIIPNQVPHGPIEFTIMAFEKGLYELSWVPPITHEDITNYTIFWCDNQRDRPFQCTGYLNWTHVSMNTTVYNITVPNSNKIYQFAISANTNKGSSGMIWSSCTVIRPKKIDKMKFVWINRIELDFIEVGWRFDCLDRIGVIEEVKIYYCPTVSELNTNCKEPKRNISVKYDPYRRHGTVQNLTARTTYKLEVTIVTKYGESQPRSFHALTTKTKCSISS